MTRHTAPANAMHDAIAGHDDSGHDFAPHPQQPEPLRRYWSDRQKNGPVQIKRLPAGWWVCDACGTQGRGWLDIEAHFTKTEHRTYTEVKAP